MKHVLSISLGSSGRDSAAEVELLGQQFLLERRGTDGSLERFERLLVANDGVVDCLCVGGTNLGLHCAGRYYRFREIHNVARRITQTPLVDGSGLKNTLERRTLRWLHDHGLVDFGEAKVLVTCGIDRFGLAEELAEMDANAVFGDTMFVLGLPWPLPSLRWLQVLGMLLLPIIVQLPFRWIYPTGGQQDEVVPKHERWYEWADVIAGDYHYIRRHMPRDLVGKTILTNTTTTQDVAELRERGVRLLVTSTPVIDGRSFATNVMEGVFVCLLDKPPAEIAPEEYLEVAGEMGWEPTVRDLTAASEREQAE